MHVTVFGFILIFKNKYVKSTPISKQTNALILE